MRRLLLVTVAAALLAPAPASAADPVNWQTPSGNIACLTYATTLRCDIRRLGSAAPRKPASCNFDYGHAFSITKGGSRARRMCVSDAVGGPSIPTVAYGRTWRRGGFRCTVRESGLRCTNPRGHGFELRIGRQRLF